VGFSARACSSFQHVPSEALIAYVTLAAVLVNFVIGVTHLLAFLIGVWEHRLHPDSRGAGDSLPPPPRPPPW